MNNDNYKGNEQNRYVTFNPQNSYLSGQIQIPMPNNMIHQNIVSNEYKYENPHNQNVHFSDAKLKFSPSPNLTDYTTTYPRQMSYPKSGGGSLRSSSQSDYEYREHTDQPMSHNASHNSDQQNQTGRVRIKTEPGAYSSEKTISNNEQTNKPSSKKIPKPSREVDSSDPDEPSSDSSSDDDSSRRSRKRSPRKKGKKKERRKEMVEAGMTLTAGSMLASTCTCDK
jgi:hypothetical protein